MSDLPEPLRRILEARDAVERAEDDLASARRRYFESVAAAHDAGQSLSAIARTLGVSRQRVARLLAETRH